MQFNQKISPKKSKGFLPVLIVGLVVIGVLLGYFTLIRNSGSGGVSPITLPIADLPSKKVSDWKIESIDFKSVPGRLVNEKINLTFEIPPDWTVEQLPLSDKKGNLNNSCGQLKLSNPEKNAILEIDPSLCRDKVHRTFDWPGNGVIVKELAINESESRHQYLGRFFNEETRKHNYVTRLKNPQMITYNEYLLPYITDNEDLLPLTITLDYFGPKPTETFQITDKIMMSLKASKDYDEALISREEWERDLKCKNLGGRLDLSASNTKECMGITQEDCGKIGGRFNTCPSTCRFSKDLGSIICTHQCGSPTCELE